MTALSPTEAAWLKRMDENGGHWPARPFLRSSDASRLMQLGLVEAIKPDAPHLSYVCLTTAGWALAEEVTEDDRGDGAAGE